MLWRQPLVGYFFENLPSLTESETVIASGSDAESKGTIRNGVKNSILLSSYNMMFFCKIYYCITFLLIKILDSTVKKRALFIIILKDT